MSIQSNMPKRFDTMDRNSQRLCWLLDMHSIELSWPEGLPPFVHKLQTDRHLAIDFWALIRSLRRGEADPLTDQQIVALVVSCVCGSNSLPWTHEDKAALADLESMLVETAASTDLDTNLPDALFVPEPVRFPPLGTEWLGAPQNEIRQPDSAGRSFPTARFSANPGPQPAPAFEVSHAPSYHLNEALSRLELTSLELKHHLDNLDSRMSRIEPHLEDISSLVASTLAAPPQNGSKPTEPISEPIPEASSPRASSPEDPTSVRSHAIPGLERPEELDIFFHDRPANWWPTSGFTDHMAKAKTAWANRSQWKSTLPTFPPHLLPDLNRLGPELKRRWVDSRQFASSRSQSINPRQIAIVASIVVGALICGTILVGGYRRPARHDAQPREVKATEQPAEPAAKPADDPTPDTTPTVVKSSSNAQPSSNSDNLQPSDNSANLGPSGNSGGIQRKSQAKMATTSTPVTSQAIAPKKGQEQGDEYVAKPTFKWLGDEPPKTSARNENNKTNSDRAP